MDNTATSTTLYSRYEYVVPVLYTVSVDSAVTNGTVTVNNDSSVNAYAGTAITVNATPAAGYELDTLTYTYNGNTYNVANGASFQMPAYNVVVRATFKLQSVNPPAGTAVASWEDEECTARLTVTLADGTTVDLDKVPVGQSVNLSTKRGGITLASVVLEVANPGPTTAEKNADGSWLVHGSFTVKPVNANHMYAPPFGWVDVGGGGFEVITKMAVTAKAAPRFSLARAASGETPITPDSEGEWLVDVLAQNKTVEIRVQTTAYGTVTLRCEAPQTSFKFVVTDYTADNKNETTENGALMAALRGLTADSTEYVVIGGTDPQPPLTGTRTLTLKGVLANRDLALDSQPVTVWAGPANGTMSRVTEWTLDNQPGAGSTEVVSAKYTIPAGYEVLIRTVTPNPGSAPTENDAVITVANAFTYLIDEVPVVLDDVSPDKITFGMTKDLTIEIKANGNAPTNGIKVWKVDVGTGIAGNWSKTGTNAVSNKALTTGVNYVYDGADIVFTNNGAGTKIIEDTTGFVAVNALTGIYDATDSTANTLNVTAAHTFSSAIKVEMMSTGTEGQVAGTTATNATTAGYVAIGRKLALIETGATPTTKTLDGFILNAKAGTPIEDAVWEVVPVGTVKDVKIYAGVEVNLGAGVSAQWADSVSASTGIVLKDGDCVIKDSDGANGGSFLINIKTSTGTDVGMVQSTIRGDAVMTDVIAGNTLKVDDDTAGTAGVMDGLFGATSGPKYALESVTAVTFLQGTGLDGTTKVDVGPVAWGRTSDCEENVFYKGSGAIAGTSDYIASSTTPVSIYVKTASNVYLKVDGTNGRNPTTGIIAAPTNNVVKLGVYVGESQDTTIVPRDFYVTFKATGNKPITVRQVATPSTAELLAYDTNTAVASNVKGVIQIVGDEIHAYGNLKYLGGDDSVGLSWTVAGDLGRFLIELESQTSATTLYYNGTAYSFGSNAIGSNQWERQDEDGEWVSIIADIVAATGKGAAANGKSVEVTVNGTTLKFVVHLDNTLTMNPTTGKQE